MEASSAVKDAYVQFLAALSGGDVGAFLERLSRQPETLFFGSAAEEWIAGPQAIVEFAGQMVPLLHGAGMTFEPGDAQALTEGTIGWVADRMTIRAASSKVQEVRVTAVFRQEDGAWKVVLYGHSLAVPDDQVEVFRELMEQATGH
jgi:ketosteroid isomerase-like protein